MLNGKAKGERLICQVIVMYKYLSQDMGVKWANALFLPFALSVLDPVALFWVFALSFSLFWTLLFFFGSLLFLIDHFLFS